MTHENDLEQHLLIDLHELLVPLVDISGLPARVFIITGAGRIALVMVAPVNDLVQNSSVDLSSLACRTDEVNTIKVANLRSEWEWPRLGHQGPQACS